jgi:uncharacterized protein YaaN involved in tellurite resistance
MIAIKVETAHLERSNKMNEELNKELWNEINELEQQICRINSCRSIITLCAEKTLGDDSGAMWAASDILGDIESKLDERVHKLSQVYRQLKEPPKPKAKKK